MGMWMMYYFSLLASRIAGRVEWIFWRVISWQIWDCVDTGCCPPFPFFFGLWSRRRKPEWNKRQRAKCTWCGRPWAQSHIMSNMRVTGWTKPQTYFPRHSSRQPCLALMEYDLETIARALEIYGAPLFTSCTDHVDLTDPDVS